MVTRSALLFHRQNILKQKEPWSFRINRQTLDELNLLGKFRAGLCLPFVQPGENKGRRAAAGQDVPRSTHGCHSHQCTQQHLPLFPGATIILSLRCATGKRSCAEYLDAGSGGSAPMVLAGMLVKKVLSGLTRDERYKKYTGLAGYYRDAEKTVGIVAMLRVIIPSRAKVNA